MNSAVTAATPAPGNRRAETQPCHDPATVRLSSGPRGTVRRLVAERRKLGTTEIGSMLVPCVVHPVEHAHIARRGDIDHHVSIQGVDERILWCSDFRHPRHHVNTHRRVGGPEVPDTSGAAPKGVERYLRRGFVPGIDHVGMARRDTHARPVQHAGATDVLLMRGLTGGPRVSDDIPRG